MVTSLGVSEVDHGWDNDQEQDEGEVTPPPKEPVAFLLERFAERCHGESGLYQRIWTSGP
jgi:hypothetical protein